MTDDITRLAERVEACIYNFRSQGQELTAIAAELRTLAQQGEVVVTRAEDGEIVMVSRQNSDGKVLGVIASTTHAGGKPQGKTGGVPDGLDYVPGLLDQTCPPKVWLQIDTMGDNDDRSESVPESCWGDLTWCYESIGGQEVVYIRADLVPPANPREAGVTARTGTVADIPDGELLYRAMRNLARRARRQPAWARISDVFGLGSTYSAQLCLRFDIDPETGKAIAPQPKDSSNG